MNKGFLLVVLGAALFFVNSANAAPSCSFNYGASSITAGGSTTISWSSSDADKLSFSCTNYSCDGSTCTYNGSGRSKDSTVLNLATPSTAIWNDGGTGADETCTFTATKTSTGEKSTCSDTLVINPPACNSSTPCDESYNGKYCRSVDGGGYNWIDPITCTESNFCQRYSCGGKSGICDANASSFFWTTSKSSCPYKIELERQGDPYCIGKYPDLTVTAELPGAVSGVRSRLWQTSGPSCTKAYCSPNTYDGLLNDNGAHDYTRTFVSGSIYEYKYEWHDEAGNPEGYITSLNCGTPPNGVTLEYPEGSFSSKKYVGKLVAEESYSIACENCSHCSGCLGGGAPEVDLNGPAAALINSNFNINWSIGGSPDSCEGGDNLSNIQTTTSGFQQFSFPTIGSRAFSLTCSKEFYNDASDSISVTIYDDNSKPCGSFIPLGSVACPGDSLTLGSSMWHSVGTFSSSCTAAECEYYTPSSGFYCTETPPDLNLNEKCSDTESGLTAYTPWSQVANSSLCSTGKCLYYPKDAGEDTYSCYAPPCGTCGTDLKDEICLKNNSTQVDESFCGGCGTYTCPCAEEKPKWREVNP